MKEIIESIMETDFDIDNGDRWTPHMDGLIVKTSKQTIKIGISDGQSCCEDAGSFFTNDDIQDFIGAEINDIALADTSLNTKLVDERFPYGFDSGGIQFVNINTNKGTLQYAVYNSHNGYYGHTIMVQSDQLKIEDSL